MHIEFSRHAKRRMNLYKISEEVIITMVKDLKIEGKYERMNKVTGFEHPIKVVCEVKKDLITIITAYPLKRGLK